MGLGEKSALLVGVGGLGCPAALALADAGIGRLVICDDDQVELSNLHRQLLFSEADVGADKLDAAARALRRRATGTRIELARTRLLPSTAEALVRGVDVVLEGADNFATKFLAADVCHLERRPIVHGAAIRWTATVWSVGPQGRPCYRCLFEDLPPSQANMSCATAGVVGPMVGLAGALMADLALRQLVGEPVEGSIFTYDGKRDRLRQVAVPPRPTCALCGSQQEISRVEESRYTAPRSCV